jgi:hypothetical protein
MRAAYEPWTAASIAALRDDGCVLSEASSSSPGMYAGGLCDWELAVMRMRTSQPKRRCPPQSKVIFVLTGRFISARHEVPGFVFAYEPRPVGTLHAGCVCRSAIRMRCPFRTRAAMRQQTRHLVPGWYEPSRWDEEEGTANLANLKPELRSPNHA